MDLEHRDLEPFEPTLRRLLGIAFDLPKITPRSAALLARGAPSSRSPGFVAETLTAYGALQRAAATEVISLGARRR
jgi:hypothetical protein